MARAEEYGCARDHYELVEDQLSIVITADQCFMGQDLNLVVQFQNKGEVARSVQAHLAGSVVFYTGVLASHFKDEDFTATVPALQMASVKMKISAQEYMPHMAAQVCLYFVVTGQAEDQSLNSIKVVEMVMPRLTMTVQGQPQVKQQMMVNVSFTNPFNFQLHNINLFMEGPGLMENRSHQYRCGELLTSKSQPKAHDPAPRHFLQSQQLQTVGGANKQHMFIVMISFLRSDASDRSITNVVVLTNTTNIKDTTLLQVPDHDQESLPGKIISSEF
ncbi:hypothetical protein F2P81_019690 [Scophthalmus maximus]|uniref:Transglutaminase C-terminal domain-containing protein n=1 Tax=Scophthalmus maximus TaxID=52904 RepID=A0A6A4S2M4_SCOMX|nr:hypothetical protein F2P81_019690 [Scophthalmus maximus]